jgi:alpha-ribazole phosphatase
LRDAVQVFLIRHPAPQVAPGVCYGGLDVDCEDAQAVAARLRNQLPPDALVYSSPLRRALKLASLLSTDVRVDERLSEISFGAWEGKRWDEIDRSEVEAWAANVLDYSPPGGESVSRLHARAVEFAASLDVECAAVVTHAGVIRALLGHWRGLPFAEWSRLNIGFGEINAVDVGLP